ncbi:hypothetical protein VNO77_05017 [Canavalia gladiata]|uniref:Uncharacterized protein n=1 Tax=Canavalia gladiata TaxID=3824 RepID=A0AAN9MY63_CANGL
MNLCVLHPDYKRFKIVSTFRYADADRLEMILDCVCFSDFKRYYLLNKRTLLDFCFNKLGQTYLTFVSTSSLSHSWNDPLPRPSSPKPS